MYQLRLAVAFVVLVFANITEARTGILNANQKYGDAFAGVSFFPSLDDLGETELTAGANFVFADTMFPVTPDATLMLSYVPHEKALGFGYGFGFLPPYVGHFLAVGGGFELQNRDGFNTLRRFVSVHHHTMKNQAAYADFRFGSEKIDGRSSLFFRFSYQVGLRWLMNRFGR